jgi:hypothetical protein
MMIKNKTNLEVRDSLLLEASMHSLLSSKSPFQKQKHTPITNWALRILSLRITFHFLVNACKPKHYIYIVNKFNKHNTNL